MLHTKLIQPQPEKLGFKISLLHQSIFFALTCGITGSIYAEDLQQKTVTSVEKEDVQQLESVVVVGNRGGIRTITESPAPVDVISGEELLKQGSSISLQDALTKLIPSFKVDTIKSWTNAYAAVARQAGLRNLGGGYTLVLVNGKRRHVGAQYVTDRTAIEGFQAADLNLIPVTSIARIEVLRDGAAAQYGSDAIAGVINIVLKSSDHGGSLNATYGGRAHYSDDEKRNGETFQTNGNIGLPLGEDGFIHLAFDYKNQDDLTRAGLARGSFYPLINGQPDPREETIKKRNFRAGIPSIEATNISYNAELPLNDDTSLYSFTTAGWREASTGLGYRRPNATSIVEEIYPDGVAPAMNLDEFDFQSVWGIKGKTKNGWSWDVSTSYGKDQQDTDTTDNLNPSLGPTSPTQFGLQKYEAYQWVTNLDFNKPFDIGFGVNPLTVAWGLDYRNEGWSSKATDPLAYKNGGYQFPTGAKTGQFGTVGVVGAAIVLPEDEADIDRSNTAAYLDLGLDVTKDLFVGIAGRYEHYDDSAGNTFNGKITSRYEFTPSLAARGTISSGFVAPSLIQQGYGTTGIAYGPINGVYADRFTKLVRTDSPIAQALGAKPLDPIKSNSYSLGLTFSPIKNLNIAIDGYRIELKDRIASTATLTGTGVGQILNNQGFLNVQGASYFANLFDTTTNGVDLIVDYTQSLEKLGRIRWSLGFNYGENKIDKIADNPEVLKVINVNRVNQEIIGSLTVANPKTKFTIGADWQLDKFNINTRLSRYDSVQQLNSVESLNQKFGAKWIVDVVGTYNLTDNLSFALGADNLFNTYPDKSTLMNNLDISGGSLYPDISPFGSYGGYYYGRVNYRF
ncbi:TonB-dependent receptor plug domain-containing protein [Acinetobacter johnsonii]|uniref:TonB-dependent receptor plug domain-containing protein n=1 Tax=Acinetobacter johnsonii TaxID=40214 RepID=UPI001F24919E|nr:TonB-dependent receptor [Acinetobacter johnsonii]UJA00804.1 TonB-dependent receptor plug domain-containing protein [Acinetobacter johnsonii]